jgi:hypothetical protein
MQEGQLLHWSLPWQRPSFRHRIFKDLFFRCEANYTTSVNIIEYKAGNFTKALLNKPEEYY